MWKRTWHLVLINFLAAFLLFQIELIVAKKLLPQFGGSYLVWGAALVFFQGCLLAGYAYSHLVISRFGIGRYRYWHLVAVLLPLAVFPGTPLPRLLAHPGVPLVFDVFWQLAAGIGLVFFVLSTTSIVFQSWLAASDLPGKEKPYVFYAVSNLGSFAALLTYPFLFEANLDIAAQLVIWRVAYLVLVALTFIAFFFIRVPDRPSGKTEPWPLPRKEGLLWFFCSAACSAAFVAASNVIADEITPAPLFWIIPLGIYLLTFVLNFKSKPYCPAWIREKIHLVVAFSMALFFLSIQAVLPASLQLLGLAASLFIVCMFCQNVLATSAPADPRGLTGFYLLIALGSFVGSMVVNWALPPLAKGMVEYPLSLFMVWAAETLRRGEPDAKQPIHVAMFLAVSLIVVSWPNVFPEYNFFGVVMLFVGFAVAFRRLNEVPILAGISFALMLAVVWVAPSLWSPFRVAYAHRNYYSLYRIYEDEGVRYLMSGTTLHGGQFIAEDGAGRIPLIYYEAETPIGRFMRSKLGDARRIAVIGLGTGSLAAYGRPGSRIDFFELDPDVERIAGKFFSYIKDSAAQVRCIIGDARLSLEKAPRGQYDLLVVDAFSGDSVPAHLLTREALGMYRERLSGRAVILIHVSNRYVDLKPMLVSNAKALGASCAVMFYKGNKRRLSYRSVWLAMTWDAQTFKALKELGWKDYDYQGKKPVRAWTDDYTNIPEAFDLTALINSFKNFRPFYW